MTRLKFQDSRDKLVLAVFGLVLALKLAALVLFSSDYQNRLFIPFVSHFLNNFDNPWQYFQAHPQAGVEFPYSPVMLYILALSYSPVMVFGLESPLWHNFFFKLPTLLLDIAMAGALVRLLGQKKKVLLYYFANPVIFYACYLHSQIDLIPTAILFFSVLCLTKKQIRASAVLLGLAVAAKLHVLAAAPLMLLLVYRRWGWRPAGVFALVVPLVFAFLVWPYWGEGYVSLVLNNPKQMLVYDSFIEVAHLKIFLPILLVAALYARFAAFRKINNDLFYTFLAMVFAAFIAFTSPAPGWYVWLFPFLSVFFIKFDSMVPEIRKLYYALNAGYLLYMVVFFIPEFADLVYISSPVGWKWDAEKFRNISFTLLEVTLFSCVYAFYKFGVKSNFFYRTNAPVVIGIAGDSAAGKSTLLDDVRSLLGEKILQLEGDADHKWERGDPNWEHLTHLNPKANYLYRQYEDIVSLRYGKSVHRSDYDHATGRFAPVKKMKARDYVVLCGLHSFYLPKMRKVIDFKIFVDTDEKLRKHWKVLRDIKDRACPGEKVIAQIDARREDSRKYIRPQYGFADMVVAYLTDDNYEIGDAAARPRLKLKLVVDSSLPLNEVVARLEPQCRVEWDYAPDLKTQTMVVEGAIDRDFVKDLARRTIINLDDLISDVPVWAGGYRGLVQYMILFHLSEKIKTRGHES